MPKTRFFRPGFRFFAQDCVFSPKIGHFAWLASSFSRRSTIDRSCIASRLDARMTNGRRRMPSRGLSELLLPFVGVDLLKPGSRTPNPHVICTPTPYPTHTGPGSCGTIQIRPFEPGDGEFSFWHLSRFGFRGLIVASCPRSCQGP